MTVFDIIIVSDTICPWCYIGYRRLRRAISLFQKTYPGGASDMFNITWKPYYVDPSAPAVGVSMEEKMVLRLGATRAQEVQQHLQRVGSSEGINFKFRGRTGNSRNSHRLMHFASLSGSDVQCRTAEQIFRAYFEEEKDITNQEMLLEAGVQAGLDGDQVNRYLEAAMGGNEVDAEVQKIKDDGVKGVPHFTVNGKQQFDGAVDAVEFFEAFIDIKQGS